MSEKRFTVYVQADLKLELTVEHQCNNLDDAVKFAEEQVREKMAALNPKRSHVRATKVGVTNYEVKRLRRPHKQEEETTDATGD